MRYLFTFMCVLALGATGCRGTGGNGAGGPCEGVTCDDANECTKDACDPVDGSCSNTPVDDGFFCDIGYCESGACKPIASVFPCTEQGILDAIAAGDGPHGFDCDEPTPVTTTATIVIDNNVILDGRGLLTIDGNDDHPVLSVSAEVEAELRRITVTGGLYPTFGVQGFGSGISNEGNLRVTNCSVSGNVAQGLAGGGIGNSGSLILSHSDVLDNTAEFFGGVWNLGTMELEHGTVSGNVAISVSLGVSGVLNDSRDGGGILTVAGATVSENTGGLYGGLHNNGGFVSVTNSTFSNNSGESSGAIFNGGPPGALTITSSTISGNTAESGAAIVNVTNAPSGSAVLTIANSVVDGNCAGNQQGSPNIGSAGYNIESPGNTCGFGVSVPDLKLGPLQNNGGPTETHALEEGSPAIDQIPEVDCIDADGNPLKTDQRGQPRPETGGTMCDVGAFEVQP